MSTSTRFKSENVEFYCPNTGKYLVFDGDNVERGEQETVTLLLKKAAADGVITTAAYVKHFAGFYNSFGSIATLRLVILNANTGQKIPASGVNLNVDPGSQDVCANTKVARSSVSSRNGFLNVTLSNEL